MKPIIRMGGSSEEYHTDAFVTVSVEPQARRQKRYPFPGCPAAPVC